MAHDPLVVIVEAFGVDEVARACAIVCWRRAAATGVAAPTRRRRWEAVADRFAELAERCGAIR
jgi:hypothetical protein